MSKRLQPRLQPATRRALKAAIRSQLLSITLPAAIKYFERQFFKLSLSDFFTVDVMRHRAMVDQMESMPRSAPAPRVSELEKAKRQLAVWKRRRTIARKQVAKYTRMVRYRSRSVSR